MARSAASISTELVRAGSAGALEGPLILLRRARIALWAAVGIAHATTECAVRAQPRDPPASLRVELRVQSELDVRLSDRLRGQTSDLPIELGTYRPARAASSMATAVTEALAHCRESHADVVVWLLPERTANAWQLAVVTCRDQHLLVRRIDGARPALSGSTETQSGALETAALVLRGALSVVAHGGTLGAVATPPAQPQPRAASTPTVAESDRPTTPEQQSGVGAAGDLQISEPRSEDLDFFAMNPLNFWSKHRAAQHGYDSVRVALAENHEPLRDVFARHGIELSGGRLLARSFVA